MRRLHEAVRDWKPCSVCGRPAPYVHDGLRYCVNNRCQLAAAGMAGAPRKAAEK